MFDVLFMVKQLGVPTFFITLSSADSKLRELVSVINKVHKLDILEEYVENLGFHDRCYFLNSNPVVVARYFLNEVEVFFKKSFVDDPLGKFKYHAVCAEFEVFGALFSLGGQRTSFNFTQQRRVCCFC